MACTDPNTDIGEVITGGGFGWWCESNDAKAFVCIIKMAATEDLAQKSNRALEYLKREYTVEESYKVIVKNWRVKNG